MHSRKFHQNKIFILGTFSLIFLFYSFYPSSKLESIQKEKIMIPYKTYTVKKGKHFSFPRVFKIGWKLKKIQWRVIFNEDCNYIMKDEKGEIHSDQKDWNKLCGVFYNMFNTRKNTAMMGWKYDPIKDKIDIAPYYHISGSTDWFRPMLSLNRGDELFLELEIDRISKKYIWLMRVGKNVVTHEMPFTHKKKLNAFINFYFGGNQKSPQEVSAKISMKTYK